MSQLNTETRANDYSAVDISTVGAVTEGKLELLASAKTGSIMNSSRESGL